MSFKKMYGAVLAASMIFCGAAHGKFSWTFSLEPKIGETVTTEQSNPKKVQNEITKGDEISALDKAKECLRWAGYSVILHCVLSNRLHPLALKFAFPLSIYASKDWHPLFRILAPAVVLQAAVNKT